MGIRVSQLLVGHHHTGELFDVIDVDPKGIPWALEHERDLRTYTQTTRRRGRHYYFLPTPGLKNSTSKVAPGVDVKTIGGLVIFWRQQGYPVIDRPMVPMPAWIVELAGKKTTSPPLAVAIGPVGDPSDREMKYAAASLDNACLELRSCAAGGRNQLLNTLAFSMGRMIARGWLARELVEHT